MLSETQSTKTDLKSYLICATPRSGSTLLCEALRNSRLAGNPDEYFGPMHVTSWNEQWQTNSAHAYLNRVLAHSKGENNVLGIKVMRLYWQNFIADLSKAKRSPALSEFALLNDCFPNLKFIWITRRDKVRQAISWMKFLQGAAWYWTDDTPQKMEELKFKPDVIRAFIAQTAVHETAWLQFFKTNKITPFIVVYEDFVQSYEETTKSILRYLEIPYPKGLKFEARQLKQQADALTDEWVQKYLAMHQASEKM